MEHERLAGYAYSERPWGDFEQFTLNEPSTVKILSVLPGEEFSLQSHQKRDEFWRVLSGSGTITLGDAKHEAKEGDEFFIPRTTKHRAEGGGGLRMLEISFGVFDENDVERFEDKYGRS